MFVFFFFINTVFICLVYRSLWIVIEYIKFFFLQELILHEKQIISIVILFYFSFLFSYYSKRIIQDINF